MTSSEGPISERHVAPHVMHESEGIWETLRWPGEHSKMLFHPGPGQETYPNAGLVRYEPGAYHPLHNHDFAQVWYILEGEFTIGDETYGQGTMLFHPDPHHEPEMTTESGGLMLLVQYQGPTTGGRPIYDGRFNVSERKPVEAERVDI